MIRDFTRLGRGLIGARALSLLTFPLVAYLYGPEPFGLFIAYMGVVNLLWVAVCGRYELAIIGATSCREARTATALSLWLALGCTAIVGLACLSIAAMGDQVGSGAGPLILLPAVLGARAMVRVCQSWAARNARFSLQSRAVLVQALVQAAVQIGAVALPIPALPALLAGDIAGSVAFAIVLLRKDADLRGAIAGVPMVSPTALKSCAWAWRQLPAAGLPGALLSVATLNLPLILLPSLFPADIAGRIALVLRLLDMPAQLLAATATAIFQNRIVASVTDNARAGLLLRGLRLYSFAVAALFAGLAVAGVGIDPLLEGSRWSGALAYAPWVAVFCAATAVGGPLVELFAPLRREDAAIPLHALAFLAMLGACWIGTIRPELLLPGIAGVAVARAAALALALHRALRRATPRAPDIGGP